MRSTFLEHKKRTIQGIVCCKVHFWWWVWDLWEGVLNTIECDCVLSQLATGCVTCHACHGCVTDFRPILGNPVEVAHMTSPGTVYISHTKGTYFPLARISTMIPQ